MVLLKNVKNIFKIPELVKKLLFTFGVLIVYRLGTYVPAIGVNGELLAKLMSQQKVFQGILSYFDTISGGALQQAAIFSLGISPYIMASIAMQILSIAVPSLERLSKEGDYGRKKINQYTRNVAILLAVIYSASYAAVLLRSNYSQPGLEGIVMSPGIGFFVSFVVSLTAGAAFVMWLGEQISLFGVGNGSSMIIFAGIISRFPAFIVQLIRYAGFPAAMSMKTILPALIIITLFVLITLAIVYLEKGDRKIPIQYARRVIGQRVYAGQSTYIPFKINISGVMPVIFASGMLNFIATIFGMIGVQWISRNLFPTSFLHNALEFGLIIFFSYFYTAIAFNPEELADDMKKRGGFVPGIRPGKQTANYFDYILNRIGLVGAVYLGVLAILPNVITRVFNFPAAHFPGGTSLLIMVGVALEVGSQIEAYLIEHKYEGFLRSGAMKRGTLR